MKKITVIFLLAGLFLYVNTLTAQIGSTCANANVISALPFVDTTLTTATSGNAYASLPCSGTFPNFMSGNDYVFSYTPLYNHDISITLTNTAMGAAVFVTDTCPDVATTCVAFNTSPLGNPLIPTVSLTAGRTYFIIVSSLSFTSASTAFDIEVKELLSYDAAVTALLEPFSNCGLTNTEIVKVKVKNLGTQAISNFTLGYSVNSNPVTPDVISTTLAAGDSMIHTFTQAADLSVMGTYQISAYVFLNGDQNNTNDTIHQNVANQAFINTLPYSEDFENGDGGWTSAGSGSTWELGTPAGTVINTPAPGGTDSWVTNLDGNHNMQEYSYVTSPCFDLTNYPNVSIKLDVWYQTSPGFDAARFEASINGGQSWFIIGGNNEPTNWYNAMMTDTGWTMSSNGWLTAQHPLTFVGGQSNVRFRVVFETGLLSFQPAEGFAFDNILIYECNDMPTADFTMVQNGNTVSVTNASQDATGYLWNYGDQMAMLPDTNTNSSYTYMTPGNYTITLAAYNQCGVSYFSQPVNITTVGIDENTDGQLFIYPNPAEDVLNINAPTGLSISKVEIFNVLGQRVYSAQSINPINVKALPSGYYTVRITTDEGIMTQKFSVK